MGRISHGPRRKVMIRVPEALYADMLVVQNMLDERGQMRYGAFNDYILSLIHRDVAEKRERIAAAAGGHHA
jgi:hypothetical protein